MLAHKQAWRTLIMFYKNLRTNTTLMVRLRQFSIYKKNLIKKLGGSSIWILGSNKTLIYVYATFSEYSVVPDPIAIRLCSKNGLDQRNLN